MPAGPSLVWFRLDLRLDDNPALMAAVHRGAPVVPVFVWAPDEETPWSPGAASRWWLHQTLTSLQRQLQALNSRLVIRLGPTLETLAQLARETQAEAVFWNRRYEPVVKARDTQIKQALRQDGLLVESHNASLLFEPWQVHTREGAPYQIFTPFWKACRVLAEAGNLPPCLSAPAQLLPPPRWPASLTVSDLQLEPRIDWAAGMRQAWQPGSAGAERLLQQFLQEKIWTYHQDRDRPDQSGSSRLSPHLHFGEISPRRIWWAVQEALGSGPGPVPDGAEVFLRELGWREFAYHLLHHFPQTPTEPLRRQFAAFPWKLDSSALRAWQKGRTGYPMVDAGMRELWTLGWMHNRVRMIVASFLVKDLLVPWQEGARWFWDTLVDADLASNTLGWQWTAGCGADAAPFFRIFNPVSQGQKFDPDGSYVRRWVPELQNLPSAWIHRPWEAPASVLREARVELGRTYPHPLVDHQAARQRAMEAWARLPRS